MYEVTSPTSPEKNIWNFYIAWSIYLLHLQSKRHKQIIYMHHIFTHNESHVVKVFTFYLSLLQGYTGQSRLLSALCRHQWCYTRQPVCYWQEWCKQNSLIFKHLWTMYVHKHTMQINAILQRIVMKAIIRLCIWQLNTSSYSWIPLYFVSFLRKQLICFHRTDLPDVHQQHFLGG